MNKKQTATLTTVIGIVLGLAVAYYVVLPIIRNILVGKVVTETVKNIGGKVGKVGRRY